MVFLYFLPPPPPLPRPPHIISHNSLRVIKHYITFVISKRGRSCFPWSVNFVDSFWPPAAKFSERHHQALSLKVGKVCCRPICYRILSHFG